MLGEKIWNKAQSVKRVILSVFNNIWMRQFNSNGDLPSGKSIQDIEMGFLKTLMSDKKTTSARADPTELSFEIPDAIDRARLNSARAAIPSATETGEAGSSERPHSK